MATDNTTALSEALADCLLTLFVCNGRHRLVASFYPVQVRQGLLGIRVTGLRAQQQVLPGLVHGVILPSSDRVWRFFPLFCPTRVRFFAGLWFLYLWGMRRRQR